MHYDFIAIPDADVPQAVDPVFQHVLQTYSTEANKTVSVGRAVRDDLLDFKPHEKTNPIRTILVHQLLSERRFFAQFVGTEEPPVEELLPPGDKPTVAAYIEKYVGLARKRLPQLAQGTAAWWLESRPFFGGLSESGFGLSVGAAGPAAVGAVSASGAVLPGDVTRGQGYDGTRFSAIARCRANSCLATWRQPSPCSGVG
jgi:hypothetical protein